MGSGVELRNLRGQVVCSDIPYTPDPKSSFTKPENMRSDPTDPNPSKAAKADLPQRTQSSHLKAAPQSYAEENLLVHRLVRRLVHHPVLRFIRRLVRHSRPIGVGDGGSRFRQALAKAEAGW